MSEAAHIERPSPGVVPAPPLLAVRNIEVVYDDVIPERLAEANPGSRDSGFGPADRPGMTTWNANGRDKPGHSR